MHWVRAMLEGLPSDWNDKSPFGYGDIRRLIETVEHMDVYLFRNPALEGLADEISCAESLSELSKMLWRATIESGFQHFATCVADHGDHALFKQRICTSFHEDWLNRYNEKNYRYVDPVMRRAFETLEPFSLSSVHGTSPIEEDFWRDAEHHGVGRNGICFPIVLEGGVKIFTSFLSSIPDQRAETVIKQNASDLHLLAQLAAECFRDLGAVQRPADCVLTDIELGFLHTLATDDNPEQAFEIQNVYGGNRSLQVSISDKMQVKSIFQAVAIASSKGWFDRLPYSMQDVQLANPPLAGVDQF